MRCNDARVDRVHLQPFESLIINKCLSPCSGQQRHVGKDLDGARPAVGVDAELADAGSYDLQNCSLRFPPRVVREDKLARGGKVGPTARTDGRRLCRGSIVAMARFGNEGDGMPDESG